jgi:hypothetical protein
MSIEKLAAQLEPETKDLFERLFQVTTVEGRLVAPEAMHQWLANRFGSVEAVQRQKIVKIVNKVTLEGALFNGLRANRPMELRDRVALEDRLFEARRIDTFRDPLLSTPEDVFGRVKGKVSVSASNVAKYDGMHGLVVFNEYLPFRFALEELKDYIDTSLEWGRRAHRRDPKAPYFFLMWNCLWRAGASIVHGHLQMTLTRAMHYAAIERLRRCALDYRNQYGSNYFDDLLRVHQALGCAFPLNGVMVMTPLTPVKEKEVILLSHSLDDSLKIALYEVLSRYRAGMGVVSFNLALLLPPLSEVPEDWSGFPVQFRLVDRGDPMTRTSDIGAMELYAQPVIASDPFHIARLLRETMVE